MHDATQPVTPDSIAGAASPPTGSPPDLAGQTVGDFHIVRTLGQGGMGAVYLAEQISLKRNVALKFLRPDLAANPTALSRFRREAEAVARLAHRNIVQVYSIGAAGGRNYMALEYVEGRNLGKHIERKGPLEVPVVLAVLRQVAAALQRAADANIIHRDIKPENILLTRTGEVKVADFGLSRDLAGDPDLRLTQDNTTMGTPLYMSPEQAQGNPMDARSDIYSLGVTCYHMLAGQPPFRGRTAVEVALKHVNEEPPPLAEKRPGLPPALLDLVRRMMSKDPAQRPQSGRDVLRELSQPAGSAENPFVGLTTAGTVPTRSATIEATPVKPAASHHQRWPWLVGAVAIVLAGASGAGVRLLVNARATPPGVNDHPNLPAVSDQERRLIAAAGLYPEPKLLEDIRQGAGHHVELGILYWDQKRYADAAQMFAEMGKRPKAPTQYKVIATLGSAVTEALRDEVDKSNKLFLEARGSGAGPKPLVPQGSLPGKDLINLRYWVEAALDRNATRGPLPKELQDMRREISRRPATGGAGKANRPPD